MNKRQTKSLKDPNKIKINPNKISLCNISIININEVIYRQTRFKEWNPHISPQSWWCQHLNQNGKKVSNWKWLAAIQNSTLQALIMNLSNPNEDIKLEDMPKVSLLNLGKDLTYSTAMNGLWRRSSQLLYGKLERKLILIYQLLVIFCGPSLKKGFLKEDAFFAWRRGMQC